MKRWMIGAAAAVLAISIGTTTAFAAGRAGDGLCDRRQTCGSCAFVDADGDGLCDRRQTCGSCAFVDADGDGLCDRRQDGGCGAQGRHHGWQ